MTRKEIARKFISWVSGLSEGTTFGFPNPKTGLMYQHGALDVMRECFGIQEITKDPNMSLDWTGPRSIVQELLYQIACGTKSEANHANKKSRLTKFDGSNVSRYGLEWDNLKAMRYDASFDSPIRRHKGVTQQGSVKITKVTFVRV